MRRNTHSIFLSGFGRSWWRLAHGEGQNLQRVHASLVDCEAPMKVRAGNAPGSADFSQNGTFLDLIADTHGDGLHMPVVRVDAEAMVNHDCIAGEEEVLGKHDPAALGGVDGSAGGGGKVYPAMRRSWLAIEDAAPAEVLGVAGAVEG